MVRWRKVRIEIHCSNAYQNAQNCLYQYDNTAETAEEFEKLVRYDHVFFDFKDGYRSIKNFLGTSVAALDCDNDHSDNEADWLTLRKLTEIFSEVQFAAYTSRNHMKQKGSKAPRPRFHILFPIGRISSAEEYVACDFCVQDELLDNAGESEKNVNAIGDDFFVELEDDSGIPNNSIMREFIGGSVVV